MSDENKGHPLSRAVAFFVIATGFFSVLALGVWLFLTDPNSPVPDAWSPLKPLRVADPLTPVTAFKLRKAVSDPAVCRATLARAAKARVLDPLVRDTRCHIRNRVKLSVVGDAKLAPLETSCETALRLAMWERHGLQAAAQLHLGQPVQTIRHIGSYNCRSIRGSSDRTSTHSTADSIDIGGVTLTDGTRIELVKDWDKQGPRGAFLRALRDAGCKWFATVLGPEFDTLHADHFHMQNRGWGTCR